MTDIVDEIDRLVDEQMAGYTNRSGYDHNVNQAKCPHCHRDWHGLAITKRMEQMRWYGIYDENYRYSEDTSEVLCPGSAFIGPRRPPKVLTPSDAHARWLISVYNAGEGDDDEFPDEPVRAIPPSEFTTRNYIENPRYSDGGWIHPGPFIVQTYRDDELPGFRDGGTVDGIRPHRPMTAEQEEVARRLAQTNISMTLDQLLGDIERDTDG